MQIIGHNIVRLAEVDSTNNFAANLVGETNTPEGTVIMAQHQSQGRGQRGSNWESVAGQNLTFSIVLHPKTLPVEEQFVISRFIALAICEALEDLTGLKAQIKWPNDILIHERKVAGVLIENMLNGKFVGCSIVGIGVNVNQTDFSALPKASSLKVESGNAFDTEKVFQELLSSVDYYYQVWQRKQVQRIESAYLERLFRFNQTAAFNIDGETRQATLVGVKQNGRLQLKIETGQVLDFDIKEVEFLY